MFNANFVPSVLISNQDDHINSFKCLVINKRDGSCSSFSGNDQVDFSQCAACLDPLYNVIWSLNSVNNQICAYNVICSEARNLAGLEPWLLSPALAIPVVSTCFVTRSQAAMYLLASLDTLTQADDHKLTIVQDNDCNQSVQGKIYSREDFSIVTRFESESSSFNNIFQNILSMLRVEINRAVTLQVSAVDGDTLITRLKLFNLWLIQTFCSEDMDCLAAEANIMPKSRLISNFVTFC